MKKNVKSFFDIMDIILKKHDYPDEEEVKKYCSIWLLNMQMSCSESLTQLAHELSKLKLTNKEYFDFCYYGIPKMNIFIKYTAKKAKQDQEIKWISEYFSVSLEQAKQYIKLLPEDEKQQIFEYFNNRGIKK